MQLVHIRSNSSFPPLSSPFTILVVCEKPLSPNKMASSSSLSPALASTLNPILARSSRSSSILSLTHKTMSSTHSRLISKAQTLDFSGPLSESGFGGDDDTTSTPGSGIAVLEDKEEPQCPPGLRPYETMAVLRPDMSEDERLTFTQKYEEMLVAGGGMYVEVFNRGVIPLAYSIRKKNKAGETNNYLDGICLLFTYFSKPESIIALEATLTTDDDVIRSSTFKTRKRKN